MRWSKTAVLTVALGLLAGRAEADVAVALTYEAPLCPPVETFRELVAARLGRDPFVASAADVVRVEVVRRGPRWVGTLTWSRAGAELGRRELEIRGTCAELVESLAVGLSILLEDPAVFDGGAPPPAPPPESPDPPAEPSLEASAEVVAPPAGAPAPPPPIAGERRRTVGLRVELGGATTVRVTPGFALSTGAALGLRIGSAELRLEGIFDSQLRARRLRSGDRVRATHGAASLFGCVTSGWFVGCLGAGLGAFSARVTTVVAPRTHTSLSASVVGRLGFAIPLAGRLYLAPYVELRIALTRTVLAVDGEAVWEQAPAGARLGLRLGLRL